MKRMPITEETVKAVKNYLDKGYTVARIGYIMQLPISVIERARINRLTPVRKCIKCGKEYFAISTAQRYCSEACRKPEASQPVRCCITCGKVLTGSRKRYCSKDCNPNRNKSIRTCKICGKVLTGKHRSYCSSYCEGIKDYNQPLTAEEAYIPREEKPSNAPNIVEICSKAKAEGLSYGEYMAKK